MKIKELYRRACGNSINIACGHRVRHCSTVRYLPMQWWKKQESPCFSCGECQLDMLENVETIKSDIEITKQNIAEPSDEWKDIVYHKYNDDRTSYECVPCYNSVDEYIASEKEDLESYKADLEEALEELKDMRADWKPEKEPNMNEEIELIKKWVKEREDFINE